MTRPGSGKPARNTAPIWADEDRPRERLNRCGPQSLSNVELITLLLGSGSRSLPAAAVAGDLMKEAASLCSLASRNSLELMRIRGIGQAGAARIVAAFELGRRACCEQNRKHRIRAPADVSRFFGPKYRDLGQERFGALLLDSGNHIIGDVTLSLGTLNASLVHPREVFKAAVDYRAAGIILIHNHPSGDPTPSREDRAVTRQLIDASRIMAIPVLDHVILAGNSYYSFAENGMVKN